MSRPAIPAEIRRAVLVEAGHRCAIPRCAHPDVDIHHIVPWEISRKHEYKNLLALCPNCHRRAHVGEIDRRSLYLYKASLIAAFRSLGPAAFTAPIIEAKRRIYEVEPNDADCVFDFELPDFFDADACIASKNIEAWGNELLTFFRYSQEAERNANSWSDELRLAWLIGKYKVVRRDAWVLSVQYIIQQMYFHAAHRSTETRVQNFLLAPFQPLPLEELLCSEDALIPLSELAQARLLQNGNELDPEHVRLGTSAKIDNFSCFTISRDGFEFIFAEYQVASYAAGQERIWVSFHELAGIFKPEIMEIIGQPT